MENNSYVPPKVLSIAGFDGCAGAGLQADLKVFSAFGCYGLTILTSLPIQNTQGVKSIHKIPASVIEKQLECMFDDITPSAIKIGMLFNASIIKVVSSFLEKKAKKIPIILDPVMVAKSGDNLLHPKALKALKTHLVPLVSVITPNLPEASLLLGKEIKTHEEMEIAAKELLDIGPGAVFLKGGHLSKNPNDFYIDNKNHSQWFHAQRIHTPHTHGTGCTLSAAIAAGISLGKTALKSCEDAKQYTLEALKKADLLQMGKGKGSLHHFYALWNLAVGGLGQ